MVEFKTISYEAVTVGEKFQSDDFLIKPEDVETYAYAVDDHHPWFFEGSPFGGRIAHPTLLGNQALSMRHCRYLIGAGLHAKMQFEFLEPLRPGMRVRTHGKVIDKYERRERHYMVTQFETRDEEESKPLVRGQFTQMIFPASGVHRGSVSSEARTVERQSMTAPAAGSPAAGAELPPLVKTIVQRQIDCFSGVRPHSIHTDPEWARQKGFRATLVQAMMSTAYVSQMMMRLTGTGFVKGGRMALSFIRPVFVDDTLTVRGRVKSREPEGEATRVTVEVWCANQDGAKAMVGTASGIEA